MMYEHLVMSCRPTLLVLIGLTLLHGTSSTSYIEEPFNCPTQKQMTIPDVLFFVNQTVTTIEATAEEVKQLKKRLDEMDVLLKSPGKPVVTKQTETEFFLFTEEKKNWFEAYEDCRIKGMALASIEGEEEYWKIYSQIMAIDIKLSTKEEDFWLSGTDLGHECEFVWMSTGRPVSVTTKWRYNQPDHGQTCEGNQKEHCMEINRSYGNSMNDFCCEKRQSYICELRKINQ